MMVGAPTAMIVDTALQINGILTGTNQMKNLLHAKHGKYCYDHFEPQCSITAEGTDMPGTVFLSFSQCS